ncbi:hypothetical protein ACL7TT_01290 [Microbulbifer sp. 2304DJ12-6]|uniref:hypothetical protein n=1 Tax=Microbulbifer sp. 2304DJ12-6 TaxID=3233340 RepID=UPI0039B0CF19
MKIRKINGEFVLEPLTSDSEALLERLIEDGGAVEVIRSGECTVKPCVHLLRATACPWRIQSNDIQLIVLIDQGCQSTQNLSWV